MESFSTYLHTVSSSTSGWLVVWIYLFKFEGMTVEAEEWNDPFDLEEHWYSLRRLSGTEWHMELTRSTRLAVTCLVPSECLKWEQVPSTAVPGLETQYQRYLEDRGVADPSEGRKG